jgi:membrane protein DedA with SNARE-associated domain
VNAILQFVFRHGYSILFAAIFARQLGFPIPGPLFLLSAGALAAAGKLSILHTIGLTIAACVLADWVWYEAGRRGGDKVLHFMHRLIRDPDFHDRTAKKVFARYGLALLLVAKFVPGLDAVAPPLAGTLRTSRYRFLAVDAVGSGIYGCVYGGLGYLFSNDLDRAVANVSRAGTLAACLVISGISIYTVSKLIQRFRFARVSRLIQATSTNPIEFGDSADTVCRVIGGQGNGE